MELVKTEIGLSFDSFYNEIETGIDYPGLVVDEHLLIYDNSLETIIIIDNYKTNEEYSRYKKSRKPLSWGDKKIAFTDFIRIPNDTGVEKSFVPFISLKHCTHEEGWIVYYDTNGGSYSSNISCVKIDTNSALINYSLTKYEKDYFKDKSRYLIPSIILATTIASFGFFGWFGFIWVAFLFVFGLGVEVEYSNTDIKYSSFLLSKKKIKTIPIFGNVKVYCISKCYYLYDGNKLVYIADDYSSIKEITVKAVKVISKDMDNDLKLLTNG